MTGVQTCAIRSEEHTSELQSHDNLVCRLLLEKKTEGKGGPGAGGGARGGGARRRRGRASGGYSGWIVSAGTALAWLALPVNRTKRPPLHARRPPGCGRV